MGRICTEDLFDLTRSIAAPFFAADEEPYRVLSGLADKIIELGKTLDTELFDSPQENVWIAKSAKVAPSACIMPPCIIDEGAEIRHCAFIRGSAVVGKGAVVGNSTEVRTPSCLTECRSPISTTAVTPFWAIRLIWRPA